jgi:hypothetical protein
MALANPAPPTSNVIQQPLKNEFGLGDYVLWYATTADTIPAWGTTPAARDKALREFWPTEPMFASALFSVISRYASFGWRLTGDAKRTIAQYEQMLHSVERGQGWEQMVTKFLIDYLTQDNGAFLEVVRFEDSPTSPVVTLNHLDSNRCIRTGRTDVPVIYVDRHGLWHDLKWYQVIYKSEFPSPVENMRGMGYSALTRCLRAAQIMYDISVYKREKVSGRFTRAIWLVSGVTTKSINDVMATHQANADGQNLLRYLQPAVLGSLDPTAKVAAEKIELASLPDGYDESKSFQLYINQLALAFGGDYQDLAPLAGGTLGNGQQSETLHLKARAKGPRLFMTMLEHAFNFHGVFPSNIKFEFGDQDISEDLDKTKLQTMRAEERAMRIKSGEITPAVARQLAVATGDLDEKYLAELDQADKEQQQQEQEQAQQQLELQHAKLTAGGSNDPSADVNVGKPKTTNNRNSPGTVGGATNGR